MNNRESVLAMFTMHDSACQNWIQFINKIPYVVIALYGLPNFWPSFILMILNADAGSSKPSQASGPAAHAWVVSGRIYGLEK